MKLGEFNMGIHEGDKVEFFFDDKTNIFFFQGKLAQNFVWLKAMRLYTAVEKEGFNEQLQNASTFASIVQNNRLGAKYGFEIHVHTYFVNKILPEMLKQPPHLSQCNSRIKSQMEAISFSSNNMNTFFSPNFFFNPTFRKNSIENKQYLERELCQATTDEERKKIKEQIAQQEIEQLEMKKNYEVCLENIAELNKGLLELQNEKESYIKELNRLATHANAVIFTISLSSDAKIVPDGSAVALALSECQNELNMRCETILKDAYLQHFSFREVRQPYFFFMTEIAGMFNPSMLALKASDPYFLELFKGLFPALNAASVLQSNLENMRHLQSLAPSEILRKTLLQMEIGTPTFVPPPMPAQALGAVSHEPPPRVDYLKEGALIGHDTYNREVRMPFRKLFRHIMIEGLTGTGKSTFGTLLVSKAIEDAKMNVIVMDTGYRWTTLIKRYDGIIFKNRLDISEALRHPLSLCIVAKGNVEAIENNFLYPFFDGIVKEREKKMTRERDILLVIDEAHNFGKKLRRGTLVDIATELGKHGVTLVLISQRDKQVGVDARSQASLHFNTQISQDYVSIYQREYTKDKAQAMSNIQLFNLFVHGNDIKNYFEMKPLMIYEGDMLSDAEMEKYSYKGEPEPIKPPETIKPMIQAAQARYAPKLEIKIELEKPKDELTEDERKLIEALKANGGMFDSSSKWFKAIGIEKTGETTQKIELSLEKKGYVVFEKINPTKKVIRLTEKGKAGQPR